MNIQEQSEQYIQSLESRKRSPVKPATLHCYGCYLQKWILPRIGGVELQEFENGQMRDFVQGLVKESLSPASIQGIIQVVKSILQSAQDGNGNQLYPRVWNQGFIDAPLVDSRSQKAPILTPSEALGAIQNAPSLYGSMFLLAAASGLRIGEVIALKGQPGSNSSFWNPEAGILVIQKSLWNNQEQAPKTSAGQREIDLSPEANEFLKARLQPGSGYLFQNRAGGPIRLSTAYDKMHKVGVPGLHAFRRYRATHLESMQVPRGLVSYWLGHSDKTITDRYIKIGQDLEVRKHWAKKAGLGFNLG